MPVDVSAWHSVHWRRSRVRIGEVSERWRKYFSWWRFSTK